MADANIRAVITAKDEASAALKNFGNNASSMGDKIAGVAKVAGVALLAAGAAATAFAVSSVKAYEDSENKLTQLNAVIKSTGGIAGVTADKAIELSKALQKTTKFSDEQVISAENLLLTFTAIGKDIFPQATKTVLNMATALGEDTSSASIQLGKALQDPILGITALRRVGVNFSDAQKDVIKNLVETGHKAEAQRAILKELETEFGGSAEAAGGTFAGSLAKLKNSFNDIQESVGLTIVRAITPFAQSLSNFVNSDQFKAWLDNAIKVMQVDLTNTLNWLKDTGIPLLKKAFDELWPVVKIVFDHFVDLVKFLTDHEWVFWAIVGVIGAIKTALFLEGALQAFQLVMTGVASSAQVASAVASSSIAGITGALFGAIAASGALSNALTILSQSKAIDSKLNEARDQLAKIAALHPEKKGEINQQLLKAGLKPLVKGGPMQAGQPYLVGEAGPELVVPRNSGTVIPNNKLASGISGSPINITFNGVFTGSQMEFRQLAVKLSNALNDAKGMGTV